jgi:peptide deformylase
MSDVITIDTGLNTNQSISYKYEPYELVYEGEPILKEYIDKFDFENNDIDIKELCGRMKKTLEVERGFGLAAPQCGLRVRMFVMGAEGDYSAMFNPTITWSSENTTHMEEGCLSFSYLTVSITRPERIKVKFQDETGIEHEIEFSGLTARIIQHEIDHLNGITFDTIAKPLALKAGKTRREKKLSQYAKRMKNLRKYVNAKTS